MPESPPSRPAEAERVRHLPPRSAPAAIPVLKNDYDPMTESIENLMSRQADATRGLFDYFTEMQKAFLVRSDLVEGFQKFAATPEGRPLQNSELEKTFLAVQEATLKAPYFYLAVRTDIARWHYLRFHMEQLAFERVSVSEFLNYKEQIREEHQSNHDWVLEIDLSPFERDFPKLERTQSIGRGVEYLNRHLSSRLFTETDKGGGKLLDFLSIHQYRGQQIMLNGAIRDVATLRHALRQALGLLDSLPPDAEWDRTGPELKRLGFEPGWGRTAARIADSMNLLAEILEAPDPLSLENFLGRIPMIFNLVILSPHGYFGQANVLGKPDTGGQVVYILDQVRALEKEMRRSIHEQGLDLEPQILVLTRLIPEAGETTCNQPEEPIAGTTQAKIIRIPFRYSNGEIVPHWISRFKIWPFLERFALEAETEVLAQLNGRPDFIIGNYSDGNLVASLLAHRLGVTQCNIAHALEKTKYLHSDLYWKEHEAEHHFSCQFTADLIAMNTADFIISSTFQEIAGTPKSIGQYESYTAFSLPGLYRVVNGIDSFDPKFNIVSPGADPEIFYPYNARRKAPKKVREDVAGLVHGGPRPDALGEFADKSRPVIFAMSRLDRIKNVTGLVDWYGQCPPLREKVNLLVIGGQFDPQLSSDSDERYQINLLHELIAKHHLDGSFRWVVMQTDKIKVGSFYRYMARHRGAFIQPALFEAFGLTVIEAMSSGLPVFATRYGGPLEIIESGISGFHIDPNHGDAAARLIAEFFAQCHKDPEHWDRLSKGALTRVAERYTWKIYAHRLLTLSRIYGFWKHISNIERQETRRYLEMFYGLMFKPLAAKVPIE